MTLQAPSSFDKPMPHGYLVFGVWLIFLGVVYTCMGESYEKGYGWIYRSKDPKGFWWSIATYYLMGIFSLWPMCSTYHEILCLVFCSLGSSYTSYICWSVG
jgi:RsiW-degrading membrane proteinase PrsW (M82 family)